MLMIPKCISLAHQAPRTSDSNVRPPTPDHLKLKTCSKPIRFPFAARPILVNGGSVCPAMQATILGVIFDSPLPLSATSNPPARPIDPTLAAHPGSNHGSPLHCYHFGPRRGSSLLDYLKSPPDWRPLLAPARFCLVSKRQKIFLSKQKANDVTLLLKIPQELPSSL